YRRQFKPKPVMSFRRIGMVITGGGITATVGVAIATIGAGTVPVGVGLATVGTRAGAGAGAAAGGDLELCRSHCSLVGLDREQKAIGRQIGNGWEGLLSQQPLFCRPRSSLLIRSRR